METERGHCSFSQIHESTPLFKDSNNIITFHYRPFSRKKAIKSQTTVASWVLDDANVKTHHYFMYLKKICHLFIYLFIYLFIFNFFGHTYSLWKSQERRGIKFEPQLWARPELQQHWILNPSPGLGLKLRCQGQCVVLNPLCHGRISNASFKRTVHAWSSHCGSGG